MISRAPRLRGDLTVSHQGTEAERVCVVKEPESGNFFRFGSAEWYIAEHLDGETTLEAIRQETEKVFEAQLSTESLDDFVRNLEKNGLLETEAAERRKKRNKPRRLKGNLLMFRFKLFDPTRVFDWLLPRVSIFFTRSFVVLAAVLSIAAIAVTTTNWSAFIHDLSQIYRLSAILPVMIIIFLVVSLHEFAHGLTCRHFGGAVHEIGFLLIYFQPALYCNVSDAWLFPEKSKRLWVGFAGPWFEMFIWALSVMVWRIADTGTWIGTAALIVMSTSGLKMLINLNPVIKLDGYYLLSDYLEIPNLRKKSFRYVGNLTKWFAGARVSLEETLSWREKKIFLAYGLLATGGAFLLLAYVIVTAGGYLVEGRQPAAVMLSVVFLGLKIQRRVRRLFGKSAAADDLDEDSDLERSEKEKAAIPKVKAERKKQPHRKWHPRWHPRMVWIALAVLALPLLIFGRAGLRVSGPFNILPRENTDVRAAVEGIVQEVYVDEGSRVNVGDLIARLSDRDQVAELQKVETDIQAKQARLRMLEAGTRPEEIELARATIETSATKNETAKALYLQARNSRDERLALTETGIKKAEERLQFAEKTRATYQALEDQGLGSRLQLNQAAEEAALRKRELEEARAARKVLLAEDLADTARDVAVSDKEMKEANGRLTILEAGARKEEIEALQADLQHSKAEKAFLQEQIDRTRVVSPTAGIVATPSRLLKEMPRQLLKKGDLIAKIYDFNTVTAQIVVPEKEIAEVRVGQPVSLRARAYPNETFRGTVISIATAALGGSAGGQAGAEMPSSAAASDAKTVVVTTVIDNRDLLLKPEMTGQAKIFCGSKRIFDLVTRRMSRTVKVEFWSWW